MYDIIIFEGLDRSGKTTTKKEMERLTNYKYICIDRMYLTAICYEKIKNRKNNINDYYNQFEKLCKYFKVLIVYCKISSSEIIKKRIIKENEKILFTKEVDLLIKYYDEEIEKLLKNKQCDIYVFNADKCSELKHYHNQAKKLVKEINL